MNFLLHRINEINKLKNKFKQTLSLYYNYKFLSKPVRYVSSLYKYKSKFLQTN